MDLTELKNLAQRTRGMREAGITLVSASVILALFIFIPISPEPSSSPAAAVVATIPPDALKPFAPVVVDAKAAIVYDLATGQTLYAKNADAQLPLASLTKLLTVYAALIELSPKATITISESAARLGPPQAFSVGQRFALSDIARLTLTASLNDGAAAIAEAAAARGNSTQRAAFASAISALNLSQTYALNGSGLDETSTVSGAYGSARDMARLAGALVETAPTIALATTRPSAQASSEGGTHFSVKNTDPVVGNIPHLLLSKTGFTDLAGGNLAIVFDIGISHPIAVVVLGSTQDARFTDSQALIAATLAYFAGVDSL